VTAAEERPARIAFMVHGLGQASAACAAAAEAGRPIILLSAPNAAQFAGIGWFKALVDEARALYPGVDLIGVLDCGDAAGRAMQAMAHGIGHLVFDEASPALPRLRGLAARHGTELATELPAHVDLGAVADPGAAARAALRED
jgi:fructose/tagatose bisphosphate aldolase